MERIAAQVFDGRRTLFPKDEEVKEVERTLWDLVETVEEVMRRKDIIVLNSNTAWYEHPALKFRAVHETFKWASLNTPIPVIKKMLETIEFAINKEGAKYFIWRKEPAIAKREDFVTGNMAYRIYSRFSVVGYDLMQINMFGAAPEGAALEFIT